MSNPMTDRRLFRENLEYQGSGGVSQGNQAEGFKPAFCDMETGRVELSCLSSGAPAPVHMLCGLPEEWVVARDSEQAVTAVKDSVVAGFLRAGRFFTREQAAHFIAQQRLENDLPKSVN